MAAVDVDDLLLCQQRAAALRVVAFLACARAAAPAPRYFAVPVAASDPTVTSRARDAAAVTA